MKILITCDLFPPEIHGGTEFAAYKTAKTLKENGHEVFVICNGNPEIKEYEGIPTFRIRMRRQFLANILWIPIIFKLARKVDVIHNFTFDTSFASIIVAKLLRKPAIASVQGVYGDAWIEMRESYLRGKIRKFFEKIYLRLPFDKFHMISNYSFQIGRKMGLRKEKAVVIPWGIDWKEYKVVKKEPFVLFVGRIENQKGLIYLIEAAKRLPNVKFLIAGKGSKKKS